MKNYEKPFVEKLEFDYRAIMTASPTQTMNCGGSKFDGCESQLTRAGNCYKNTNN